MSDQTQVAAGGGEGVAPVPPPDVTTQPPTSDQTQVAAGGGEGVAPVPPPDVTTQPPTEEPVKELSDGTAVNSEVKVDINEVQPSALPEVKTEEIAAEPKVPEPETTTNGDATAQEIPVEAAVGGDSGDWQQRETELIKKIAELEKVKLEAGADHVKLELKVKEEEIDILKSRIKNLETELQASLTRPGAKNHEIVESIKQQHEELLSKARGMIFDKTKMVKNQELQIEALNTQVQSLKDVNKITKDLLQIRNGEVKSLEERLEAMDARFKAEKERLTLILKRAETSSHINDDLRKEYETQLKIFKELREKYDTRVQALVAENNRLKESLQGGPSG